MVSQYWIGLAFMALTVVPALAPADAQQANTTTEPESPSSLTETYESWTVQCVHRTQGEHAGKHCQMSQELLQPNSRQRVLLFAVTREGETAKATLVLPFGLLLQDGVRVEAEGAELFRAPIRTCLPTGCLAEAELPESVLGQLMAGETASVMMTANSGQPAKTDISLKGFSPAHRRLAALAGS